MTIRDTIELIRPRLASATFSPNLVQLLISAITTTAALALLFASPLYAAAHSEKSTGRPNVILILADDLGYRELGSFGQKLIRTPNLDRLAAQGMKLTQHYCGNAVCAPSRCVLMTGKHPGHAYVRDNRSTPPEGQEPIPDSEVTLGELLHAEGYVTGAFGKWGLGGPDSCGEPLSQGFDRFFGYLCQGHAHSYYPSYLRSDRGTIELNNNPPIGGHDNFPPNADRSKPESYNVFKGTDYAPDRINAQVLEFIRTNKEKPFLCYYPTIIPHVALHVPDEELQPYLKLGWNDPPFTKEKGYGYTPHFTPRAAYAAMITRMDRYVGNVLKLLDELGLADNTLVVFSSDNGTTHLDLEVDFNFFRSVGELRGLKGSLYEGGVRVPTLARWPGHIAAGSESDRVSGFEDWLPTVMTVAGAADKIPQNTDGISLLPTLLGQQQAERPFLYREFGGYGGQQTIRVGPWKAVRQNLRKGTVQTELYKIADDIGEQHDVAAANPDVVAKLERLMAQQHVPSKVFPLKALDDLASGD
ncbi:MAG: arylsulfatase [Planctomycetaceae bacterium]|nr:arylsulfatase [Planctomycetaceae bacterium]